VAINVIGTNALGAGFVTAWREGQGRPEALILNLAGVGE